MKTSKTLLLLFLLLSLLLLSEECSENKPIKSIIIAPNPANDHIEIIFELIEDLDLNIGIYDINGNKLLEPANNISYIIGENRLYIQTTSLSPGTYLCRFQSAKYAEAQKFIIRR
jgi:hypothetical protein